MSPGPQAARRMALDNTFGANFHFLVRLFDGKKMCSISKCIDPGPL
jgi:hypothetical protein